MSQHSVEHGSLYMDIVPFEDGEIELHVLPHFFDLFIFQRRFEFLKYQPGLMIIFR